MNEKRKRPPVADKKRSPEIPVAGEVGTLSVTKFEHDQEVLTDEHLSVSADGNKWQPPKIDYSNVVMANFTREQAKTLFAPWDDNDFLIHPTLGSIYIPAAKIKDRLTQAFGALRWRAIPMITPDGIYIFDGDKVYVVSSLVVPGPAGKGVIIDIATGVGRIFDNNPQSNKATACQMAQTYALKSHASNIGMVTASRDSSFFEEYKRKNCVQVWVNESAGPALRWRRNWDAPFLGEIGTLAEVRLGSKEGDKIPLEKASGAMKHANVRPTTRTVKDVPTLTRGQIDDVLATMERFSMPLDEVLGLARAKYAAAEIRQVPQTSFQEFLNAITLSGMRRKYFASKDAAEKFEALQKAFVDNNLDALDAFKAAFKNLALKDLSELAGRDGAEVVRAAKGVAKS